MKTPQCTPCNGTNPKTGKPVGSIHRWSQNGICDFCGRSYGSIHPGKIFAPKFGKHTMPAIAGFTFPRVSGHVI